jgi:hypothetical protein
VINSTDLTGILRYVANNYGVELITDDGMGVVRDFEPGKLSFRVREDRFNDCMWQEESLDELTLHRLLPRQLAPMLIDKVADAAAKLRGKRLVKLISEMDAKPIDIDQYQNLDQVMRAAEHLMDLASKMRKSLDAHA